MTLPLAILDAISHGSCVSLPTHDGWLVPTEPTLSPCCRAIRALYIVRQVMEGASLDYTCRCCECEDAVTVEVAK